MKSRYMMAKVFGVIIFIGCSIPGDPVSKMRSVYPLISFFLSDIWLHIIGFGAFAFVLGWECYRRKRVPFPYARIGIYSVGYGVFIEVYQLILPYRAFEWSDIMADCVGVVAALGILYIVRSNKQLGVRSDKQ